MNVAHVRQLFDYDAWANRRVWDCVESLSDEQIEQGLDYSVGSIRTQVLHTMGVQSWWVGFLATGELRFLDDDDFPTRDLVLAGWDRTEAATRDYLATLTDDGLDRLVLPGHWAERGRAPITVWQALFQVLNHGTDHRAQTLAGIHRLGGRTVAQDFVLQVWGE